MLLNKLFNTVFVIALLISVDAFGQTGRFEIGLEGGENIALLISNNQRDISFSTINTTGGVAIQYHLNEYFSIRFTPSYRRIASRPLLFARFNERAFLPLDGRAELHDNYDYLHFPLLLRFNSGAKWKYFINAGLYYSYLIRHSLKEEKDGNLFELDILDKETIRMDWGVILGVGLRNAK